MRSVSLESRGLLPSALLSSETGRKNFSLSPLTFLWVYRNLYPFSIDSIVSVISPIIGTVTISLLPRLNQTIKDTSSPIKGGKISGCDPPGTCVSSRTRYPRLGGEYYAHSILLPYRSSSCFLQLTGKSATALFDSVRYKYPSFKA